MNSWLIEQGEGTALEYLTVSGNLSGGSGAFIWYTDAHSALRFSRTKDALLFINAMRYYSENMSHKHTIRGLRNGDGIAVRVAQHHFDDQ